MGIAHDPGTARSQELSCEEESEADTIRTGFVPPNALSRLLLHGMKNVETALPFRMPFGTSILAWGRLRDFLFVASICSAKW